jgi:mRNA-degrading endonuclease RelE of RelBE toxin-antitoxin system
MYFLVTTPHARRKIRKFNRALKSFLLKETKVLENNPWAGQRLTGQFLFLYSLHLKFRGVQYRVIYQILEKEKQVIIHLIGPRENLYDRLKRLFG